VVQQCGFSWCCCSAATAARQAQDQAVNAPDQANTSIRQTQLGAKTLPTVQPGCTVMFLPGQWCLLHPSPFVKGCCTPGHACTEDTSSITGRTCRPVDKPDLLYTFDQAAKGGCDLYVDVGGQCGGAGFECYKYNRCDQFGPWTRACCPNGYSCQPAGQDFRLWRCRVDVQDAAPGEPGHTNISCGQPVAAGEKGQVSQWG
jgi:hypothetical protein